MANSLWQIFYGKFSMNIGAWYIKDAQHPRCEFTVWAPQAPDVTLHLLTPTPRSIPMQSQESGYWHVTVDDVEPGTLYQYQLGNQDARPDPASHFQPQGVHQPSQVVDHSFNWTDQNWKGIPLADLIIYELHVGIFTPAGTFEAIIPRLSTLKELGVTAIELMPVAQCPGDKSIAETGEDCAYRNWGYDGVYPFAVQNSYGGPEELKRLVDACHQQGIAVILDVVYNHFGPEGNYLAQFGPYFTKHYRSLWGDAINFDDAHSYPVRQHFIENALYWLKHYHMDGLRLDAVQAIYDFGAKHFLQELAERVKALATQQERELYLIAESDLNDPRLIRPVAQGGYDLDAQWADDFHHALQALLTGEQDAYYQDFGQAHHLAKAYRESFVYDWQYAPHRQRYHGSSAIDRPPQQFVVCLQNHDQIGNRLRGDRLSQRISLEALKLGAAAVLLSPYIPLLFMGEEYGEMAPFTYFVSHSDPDLIRAVRQGRKTEFEAFHAIGEPDDPEAITTFLKCKLNWQERQQGDHQVLWSFYQHLIQLRRTLPALQQRDRQSFEVGCLDDRQLVWWQRQSPSQSLFCVMNFNSSLVTFIPDLAVNGSNNGTKILDSADDKWAGPGGLAAATIGPAAELTLAPHSVVLYELLPNSL